MVATVASSRSRFSASATNPAGASDSTSRAMRVATFGLGFGMDSACRTIQSSGRRPSFEWMTRLGATTRWRSGGTSRGSMTVNGGAGGVPNSLAQRQRMGGLGSLREGSCGLVFQSRTSLRRSQFSWKPLAQMVCGA